MPRFHFDANEVIDLIEATGEYQAHSYSGRGMYGKECVAVTCDEPGKVPMHTVTNAVREWVSNGHEHLGDAVEDLSDALAEFRTDSMGLEQVIYWPQLEWPADRDEGGDDEEELSEFTRANAAYLARSVTGDPEVLDEQES